VGQAAGQHRYLSILVVALAGLTAGCDDGDSTPAGADAAVDHVPSDADAELSETASGDVDALTDADLDASEVTDTGASDSTTMEVKVEAGRADAVVLAPYPRPTYQRLSETGFYSDPATKTLAPSLRWFAPRYALWSDAADKQRLIALPPGTRIDTSDMNHWDFPVGTKVWKTFSRAGKPLETRLIERYGAGPEDYWMASFVWAADLSDATLAIDGAVDVNGTDHDAPAAKLCGSCHRGDKGRVLGFSALQLAHAPDSGALPAPELTLAELERLDLISRAPPAGARYVAPGDAPTQAALGYLHANCGHCHNELGTSWPDTQVVLRLDVDEHVPAETGIARTTIGRALQYWRHPTLRTRVVPGDPDNSALYVRMRERGSRNQMPPLATKHVDPAGLALIAAWITSLAP
jgi:hypothetical protein